MQRNRDEKSSLVSLLKGDGRGGPWEVSESTGAYTSASMLALICLIMEQHMLARDLR